MDDMLAEQYASHCRSIMEMWLLAKGQARGGNLAPTAAHALIARARGAIEKISGKDSSYSIQMNEILSMHANEEYKAELLVGVIYGLEEDLRHGFLTSLTDMVHGELFSNYMDMAQYLLSEGYKDAAAVIAGSTLEEHLRQLCKKHGISLQVTSKDGTPQPKKASVMNQDLGRQIISLYDQKQVTAWLDLRNNAAHGKYDEYTKAQIDLLIGGLRDFISRHPA